MADTTVALEGFEQELGYFFRDAALLAVALTHSSFANEADDGGRHNERLEFLGDAVLSLCVSSELFARFPDAKERDLERLRSRLVNASFLADMARAIGLDRHLRLGRGEENQGGRKRNALLGDAFEALLGAVYEDGGFAPARELVRRLFEARWPQTQVVEIQKGYKAQLQEIIQQRYHELPSYMLHSSRGQAHAKLFEVRLLLPDGQSFIAEGSTLTRAEHEAARNALLALNDTRR